MECLFPSLKVDERPRMADSVAELDMPELVPEISSMILSDPPELLEYDDRYARLLFYSIEVKGEVLNITFKDGTCVVQSLWVGIVLTVLFIN